MWKIGDLRKAISKHTHFFLVSVRYPCVSLTRFLVDAASIIEMEKFFLLDNCSNVYQETCEAYARIPHGYQEKLCVLRRRCKDDQKKLNVWRKSWCAMLVEARI